MHTLSTYIITKNIFLCKITMSVYVYLNTLLIFTFSLLLSCHKEKSILSPCSVASNTITYSLCVLRNVPTNSNLLFLHLSSRSNRTAPYILPDRDSRHRIFHPAIRNNHSPPFPCQYRFFRVA